MSFTISINEEAAFEVLFAGPAGPTGPQGIQGIQGVPGEGVAAGGTTGQVLKKLSATDYDTGWSSDISGVAWGGITGTLSSQTDLQNALNAKLSTSAASSTYLPLAGGYITGDIQSSNGSGYRSWDGSTKTTVLLSTYLQLNNSGAGGGALTVEWDGITFQSGKQTLPFLGLAGYATESWVTSNFYPLVGNPSAFLTASALTPYSTTVQADALYYPLTGNPSAFLVAADLAGYATESWVTSGFYPLTGNPSGFIDSTDLNAALGNYLPLAGGTMVEDAIVNFPKETTASEISGAGFVVYSLEDSSSLQIGTSGLFVNNASGAMSLLATGLQFPDATVQTTAYTGGGGGTWGSITGTLSDQTDLQSALDLKYDATNPSGFINAINGLQPTFNYSVTVESPNTSDFYSVLALDKLTLIFLNPVGGLPDSLEYRTDGIFKLDGQEMYPKRTGGSFVGKLLLNQTTINAGLNIGQTQGNVPSNTLAGDVWILDNINYKSSNGTQKVVANTNTINTFTQSQVISNSGNVPALRITQIGTGNAITVEDSTTPDATPFVINQFGKVGIGVAPDASAALKVDDSGIRFNNQAVLNSIESPLGNVGATYDMEIPVTINGVNYKISCRQV